MRIYEDKKILCESKRHNDTRDRFLIVMEQNRIANETLIELLEKANVVEKAKALSSEL